MLLNLIYMERYIGFKPIVHEEDRLLILGSMPSVMSIEQNMYYANPTNRFWKMLGYLFDMEYESKEQKLNILETNHIDSGISVIRVSDIKVRMLRSRKSLPMIFQDY